METFYIIFAITLVYISCLIGLIGTFLPILPGPTITFFAILVFSFLIPEVEIPNSTLWICGGLAVLAQILDIILTWFGAKKFGATWRGALGAFLGTIIGLFIAPQFIWIFLAPLVFAFLFEYLGGATFKNASKAGFGAFLGAFIASIIKFAMIVYMILAFTHYLVNYFDKL